jgi:hypothetical protein
MNYSMKKFKKWQVSMKQRLKTSKWKLKEMSRRLNK